MKKFFTDLSIKGVFGLFIILFYWAFGSCNSTNPNSDSIIVVEAFGKSLSLDSISARIPNMLGYDDSAMLADRIVNSWIREQVLLAQAEESLLEENEKLESQIQTYRNALLISEYENRFVNSRLNRTVTEVEIDEFHKTHPELFKLSEHVVKAVFFHIPEEELELDSAKFWLNKADSLSMPKLEKWCIEHNATYAIETEDWWYLSDLLNQVPMQIYRLEDQLKSRKVTEFSFEARTYMIKFLDHQLKDLPSPLAIARERIEEIIIQERRSELLDNLRDDLVKEAWSLGLIRRDSIPL
tara:strand:- start:25 stop:915 length:891 start_codon:yes stop_codon:yes gene_type:complete